MREKHAERKVQREECQQAREREEVRKMERCEEGKGKAMAAKKVAEHEAPAACRVESGTVLQAHC